MHPDVGAIIGISLAGCVLVVALIFLCLVHQQCCNQSFKIRNPRGGLRPSTSSQTPIANLGFGNGRSRSIETLSALNLQNQHNHDNFYTEASGIANPLWQLQCGSCGVLNTTGIQNQHHRPCQVVPNACRFCHHDQSLRNDRLSPASTSSPSSFQYHSPQLLPSDSPPPYPGFHIHGTRTRDSPKINSANRSNQPPPPYSQPVVIH